MREEHHHVDLLDLQREHQEELEEQPGQEHRREHGGENTDDQRHGEALDRARALPVEDRAGEERGQVRVEDGGERAVETGLHRELKRLAGVLFLADAFVDQHVRVDGHTEGQDDAGDAGEREGDVERRHGAEQHARVHEQRDVRHETGEAVVDEHEDHHERGAEETAVNTLADGLLTDRGVDVGTGRDRDDERQTAALQGVGNALRLVLGERAGDAGGAAVDLGQQGRGGVELTVEHDGEAAADVRAGDLAELDRACTVEEEQDLALSEFIHRDVRILDVVALHLDRGLDERVIGDEVVAVAAFLGEEFGLGRGVGIGVGIAAVGEIGHELRHFRIIVRMDEAEFELGGTEDELFEVGAVVGVHGRHADGNEFLTRGGDLGLEVVLRFQTLAEGFDGVVAEGLELRTLRLLVGLQMEQEFGTAVEVDAEADRAGGVLADQGDHVAVVLKLLRLHDHGLHEVDQVDRIRGRTVGGGHFDLAGGRFEGSGGIQIFDLVFLLLGLGQLDHLLNGRVGGIGEELRERLVEVALLQGEHGRHEHRDHGDGEHTVNGECAFAALHFFVTSAFCSEASADGWITWAIAEREIAIWTLFAIFRRYWSFCTSAISPKMPPLVMTFVPLRMEFIISSRFFFSLLLVRMEIAINTTKTMMIGIIIMFAEGGGAWVDASGAVEVTVVVAVAAGAAAAVVLTAPSAACEKTTKDEFAMVFSFLLC